MPIFANEHSAWMRLIDLHCYFLLSDLRKTKSAFSDPFSLEKSLKALLLLIGQLAYFVLLTKMYIPFSSSVYFMLCMVLIFTLDIILLYLYYSINNYKYQYIVILYAENIYSIVNRYS